MLTCDHAFIFVFTAEQKERLTLGLHGWVMLCDLRFTQSKRTIDGLAPCLRRDEIALTAHAWQLPVVFSRPWNSLWNVFWLVRKCRRSEDWSTKFQCVFACTVCFVWYQILVWWPSHGVSCFFAHYVFFNLILLHTLARIAINFSPISYSVRDNGGYLDCLQSFSVDFRGKCKLF